MPLIRGPLGVVLLLALAASPLARAQNTQPVWYPPLSLYGHPVAQPYFDFPNWARYSHCRPAPLAWGYDPFPDYGSHDCVGHDVPTINCPGDFVAHRPRIWYASADLSPLQRAYPDTAFVRQFVPLSPGVNLNADADFTDPGEVPPTPPFFTDPIFGTGNLEPAFDAGGKFTVGAHVLDCFRIEGTYTGSYFWQTSAAINDPDGNLATVFSGFDLPPDGVTFAGATDVTLFGETRLHSAEVNVRYWVDMPPGPFDVSILVGGRFMQIDDAFRLVVTNGTTDDIQAEAENTLWGVQVGIAGDWLVHPRFWINTDLKIGIYDNQSSLNYVASGAAPIVGEGNNTAFVGDIAIVGHWQMTPWLAFNLGYQFLIVDGIANGFDNVEVPPFNAGLDPTATRYDQTGQITFHGPTIGLMAVW